ncbi:MAG: VanW family protein [Clostridia bacterium]|nr:VanW family protein [Clostridia bacterium]
MKRYIIVLSTVFMLCFFIFSACNSYSGISNEESIKKNVMVEGENVGGLKKSEIMRKILIYCGRVDKSAQDAKLDSETWEVEINEHSGKKVNVKRTVELLLNANPGEKGRLIIEEVHPRVTAEMLENNIKLLGSFTTIILDQRDERTNNIRLASERLDYVKVGPGEEFSFNEVLGKRTPGKGYEKAPIIIKTEKGPKKTYGIGGGICQLSSTLYNAVEEAGLKITERHSHSKAVGYVHKGKDAMVLYGSADFRFINPGNYPIMIRVFISGDKLTVRILENRN